jgi:hypothetical protein
MTLRSSLALLGAPVSVVFTVGTRGAWLRGTRFLYVSQPERSAWQMVDAFRKQQRGLMWIAAPSECPSLMTIQRAM